MLEQEEPRAGGSTAGSAGPVLATLRDDFEVLGLSRNEARALVAVLQLGTASASRIASMSGIGVTTVYPVLRSLAQRRLVESLPSRLWSSVDRAELVRRLLSAEEARLHDLRIRGDRAQELIETLGRSESLAVPYMHVLRSAEDLLASYRRLLSTAQREILVSNRPPYASTGLLPEVFAALDRGARIRTIYSEGDFVSAGGTELRRSWDAYHAAGVEGRLVGEVPIKLAVFDRQTTLVAMTDPVVPQHGYPAFLLIEHPGYAIASADGFERRWEAGRPVPPAPGVHPGGRGEQG